MNLRTEINPPKSSWNLQVRDTVVTLGSCFATAIGKRLLDNKFHALVNPFGTTYHPLALDRLLNYVLTKQLPHPSTYVRRNETWYNYDFHSSFFGETEGQLTEQIKKQIGQAREFLNQAHALILTYGTAFLYEIAESGRSVANCHRMPPAFFRRRLVSAEEITRSFQGTLATLRSINPRLQIILTVSPVRHVKDTLPMNSVSKSILRVACHQMQETEQGVAYFPSYELVMDDLRDYRFYQSDLIHLTPLAEDYLWKKFCDTYCAEDTLRFMEQWQALQQALSHRPFHPLSNEHQEFVRRTIENLKGLQGLVDVDKEIASLQAQLVRQPVT